MLTTNQRTLLEKTAKDLRERPDGFRMDSWAYCIAGRMSKLERGGLDFEFIRQNQDAMTPLFGTMLWPSDLARDYFHGSATSRAEAGAQAIERYLAADAAGKTNSFAEPQPIPAFFSTVKMGVKVIRTANVFTTTIAGLAFGMGISSLLILLTK